MDKEERKRRILARGEISGHCHVITGDVVYIKEEKGTTFIEVGKEGAILKHLLEQAWVDNEKEIWTGEHRDIAIPQGKYEYIPEINYNPLIKRIERIQD